MAKKKVKKPYVMDKTIQKNVGYGFSYPGESKVCKVGKYKVLVSRAERLDRYGNPVHTATLINKDGTLGASARGNGNASIIVSNVLKKNGVDTKYSKPWYSKKKK